MMVMKSKYGGETGPVHACMVQGPDVLAEDRDKANMEPVLLPLRSVRMGKNLLGR